MNARLNALTEELKTSEYHPCKGAVSKLVVELSVSEQLWLPFAQVRQSNIHTFARRFGFKVKTKTTYKGGIKGLRIKRVA